MIIKAQKYLVICASFLSITLFLTACEQMHKMDTMTTQASVSILKDKVEQVPPLDFIGETYRANNKVNIRSGPDTDYKIVGNLQSGDAVYVVAKVQGKNWYMIRQNNVASGFVHSDLLEPAPQNVRIPSDRRSPRQNASSISNTFEPSPEIGIIPKLGMTGMGDDYGQAEKISQKSGFVDLASTKKIASAGGSQFELYTNLNRCKARNDEVNLFITASSPNNYADHRINLGSIVQTAKNYCNYEKKANVFFLENNGKIREKFSILKGKKFLYKSPIDSTSVPELVKKGTYGPLLYNLSSGGLNAIIDRKSMVITRYIYHYFGFTFGARCKSVYGSPDILRSTTITSNQYGITDSSEKNIEVAPGFAKGIERYQGRIGGMTSLWVSNEVDSFIKTYGCKSKEVRNMRKALIEFERMDYVN